MLTNEQQKDEFLKDVAKNYSKIKGLFLSQIPHPEAEDVLQEAILKVASYILRRGIKKGSDYTAYLFLTYRNLIYNINQKKQRFNFIDIADLPQALLIEDEEENLERLQKRRADEKKVDEIFNYVQTNYPPLEAGLFKFYHKTTLTYKDISELTGYSFSYIWKKNKIILDDIKNTYGIEDICKLTTDGTEQPGS